MSARSLRKVLKQQEKQRGQSEVSETEEDLDNNGDESPSPDLLTTSSVNPFDLLDDEYDQDRHQASEPENADEPLLGKIDDKDCLLGKASTSTVPLSTHKSKKKKKKKNTVDILSSKRNSEDPADVMLEDLSIEDITSGHQSGSSKAQPTNIEICDRVQKPCISFILQIEPKFLSAENELRRIFGSKVVNTFQKGHQTGSSRQMRGGRRGSHGHRRTILVSPSEHWPRWDGSLSMELLETRDGCHYFKYVYSSSYSYVQRAFEAAKAIHDLNGVASILLHHPYHLDSLITMAEYFKFSGEHQMSADAIAKCLYALECAWHPMFSPLHNNFQVKYGHETNRPLFTVLFAHMKHMDRRGCHRSALEICKLLLSLDSDDPMGIMFCIDYFSLRAEEYKWLERFSEEYASDSSLWLFPNFSYSLAVCRFYLELDGSSKDTGMQSGKAASTDLLKQALMLHPSVLKKLVVKVPLKDQAWTNILKHSFFRSDQTGSPSLDHLINIYVERSYIIWRLPDLQKFLRNSALLVIETLENGGSAAQDWACVRKEAFSPDKNEYSHLLVSDFSDSVPTLPPDNLENFLADPRLRGAQNIDQVAEPGLRVQAPRNVTDRNALAVLFESMLPWVHYGEGDQFAGDDQHDDPVQGQ